MAMPGSIDCTFSGRRSGIQQGLRGENLLAVQGAGIAHLFDRVRTLIEQPPAHLHRRHDHQGERSHLKDPGCFHLRVASDSRSARVSSSMSALVWASDRKQPS